MGMFILFVRNHIPTLSNKVNTIIAKPIHSQKEAENTLRILSWLPLPISTVRKREIELEKEPTNQEKRGAIPPTKALIPKFSMPNTCIVTREV